MLRGPLELNDVLFQTDSWPGCRQKQPHKALPLRLHLAWEWKVYFCVSVWFFCWEKECLFKCDCKNQTSPKVLPVIHPWKFSEFWASCLWSNAMLHKAKGCSTQHNFRGTVHHIEVVLISLEFSHLSIIVPQRSWALVWRLLLKSWKPNLLVKNSFI